MTWYQEHTVHESGDLDVIIQNHRFRVSSATMASLSLPFRIIFQNPYKAEEEGTPIQQISLPLESRMFHQAIESTNGDFLSDSDRNTLMDLEHALSIYDKEPEVYHQVVQSNTNRLADLAHALLVYKVDPDVFHFICLSAHGIFFPWASVPIDVLVGLAHAISVYKFTETASIYAFVHYAFVTNTAIPASIEEKALPNLAQVAEVLDPRLLMAFLQDIFDLHPCHWVPVSVSSYCDQLLANVILLVVGTRAKIGQRLLGTSPNRILSAKECQLFSWLVGKRPSMSEIQSQFQAELYALQSDESDESLYYRLLGCSELIDSCRSRVTSYLFVMISSKRGKYLGPCVDTEASESMEGERRETSPDHSSDTESETSSVSAVKTWPLEGHDDDHSVRSYATY